MAPLVIERFKDRIRRNMRQPPDVLSSSSDEDYDVDSYLAGKVRGELKGALRRKIQKKSQQPEVHKRNYKKIKNNRLKEAEQTVYIGNVPPNFSSNHLRKLCGKEVESVRLRGVMPPSNSLSKGVAFRRRTYHKSQSSLNAFIVMKSPEAASKIVSHLDGKSFDGKTLRCVIVAKKPSDVLRSSHTIFLGNLPYSVCDEAIRKHFSAEFGAVKSVRLIRDAKIGIGKGFGFVEFLERDAYQLALSAQSTNFSNREIRIKRYSNASNSQSSMNRSNKKRPFPGSSNHKNTHSSKTQKKRKIK